jgi:hypothetical protein
MRKPPTGEPCAGKPPARFGGRGGREPFPTPMHEFVNHTQKEYARGDVHENRAECLFSLLKPYLRVFRGVSKGNLPGYVGFFQSLGSDSSKLASAFSRVLLSLA